MDPSVTSRCGSPLLLLTCALLMTSSHSYRPDIHWDLNIQMTYWVFFTANRVSMVRPLTAALRHNTPALINNVPPAWRSDSAAAPSDSSSPDFVASCVAIPGLEYNGTCLVAPGGAKPTVTGNLMWVMQQWHNVYRYNGYDDAELGALFPLLARAVTYYTHITNVQVDAAGKTVLHINTTVSPEYVKLHTGTAPCVTPMLRHAHTLETF